MGLDGNRSRDLGTIGVKPWEPFPASFDWFDDLCLRRMHHGCLLTRVHHILSYRPEVGLSLGRLERHDHVANKRHLIHSLLLLSLGLNYYKLLFNL